MNKHTPEPWCKLNDCGTVKIWGPQGDCVAVNIGCSCDNEANADRIVSCINNCAGINPEAVPDVVAALREAINWAEGYAQGGVIPEYLKAARAALAKLEE